MCDNMANICYFHSFTSQIRHKPAVYCRKFVQLIEYMEVKGNTMLSYGERLDAVIDYLRMSYTEFATTLQINRGTLYEIKGGRHSLSQNMVNRICAAYPQFSHEWLLTGKGDMLVSPQRVGGTSPAPLQDSSAATVGARCSHGAGTPQAAAPSYAADLIEAQKKVIALTEENATLKAENARLASENAFLKDELARSQTAPTASSSTLNNVG